MTILVAYDGSQPAQEAVEYALREHPDEEFVLFRVVELAGGSVSAGLNLAREEVTKRRDEVADDVATDVTTLLEEADADFRIETALGDPAREIVEYAEEGGVSQIVIGNHGREGVSRILLGSVAESVVRRSPVPVTVVR
ncbi:universal stress protein [Halobacteria archaeon AArc-dxtr1]|nr:universal stress protein [Halobacteria archaeon AArc-dxtr1]